MMHAASPERRYWVIAVLGSVAFHVVILFVPLGAAETKVQSTSIFQVSLSSSRLESQKTEQRASADSPIVSPKPVPEDSRITMPAREIEALAEQAPAPESAVAPQSKAMPIEYSTQIGESYAVIARISMQGPQPVIENPHFSPIASASPLAAQEASASASSEASFPEQAPQSPKTDTAVALPQNYFPNSDVFAIKSVAGQQPMPQTLRPTAPTAQSASDRADTAAGRIAGAETMVDASVNPGNLKDEMRVTRELNPFSMHIGISPAAALPRTALVKEDASAQSSGVEVSGKASAEVFGEQTAASTAQLPQSERAESLPPATPAVAEERAAEEPAASAPERASKDAPSLSYAPVPAPEPAPLPLPSPVPHYDSEEMLASRILAKLTAQKAYPPSALRRKTEGVVSILLSVEKDGSLASAIVQTRSGSAVLDEAALSLACGIFPIDVNLADAVSIVVPIEYRIPR